MVIDAPAARGSSDGGVADPGAWAAGDAASWGDAARLAATEPRDSAARPASRRASESRERAAPAPVVAHARAHMSVKAHINAMARDAAAVRAPRPVLRGARSMALVWLARHAGASSGRHRCTQRRVGPAVSVAMFGATHGGASRSRLWRSSCPRHPRARAWCWCWCQLAAACARAAVCAVTGRNSEVTPSSREVCRDPRSAE